MIRLLQKVRKRIHQLVRLSGWDVVRYRPAPARTARIFRRYFPKAVIHCFEPQPQSFQALGDDTGKAQLYTSGSTRRHLAKPSNTSLQGSVV